jgi:hypothetical protein
MSRYDIADHVGIAVETVSRAITELRRQGVIELETPRCLSMRRSDKLADGCRTGGTAPPDQKPETDEPSADRRLLERQAAMEFPPTAARGAAIAAQSHDDLSHGGLASPDSLGQADPRQAPPVDGAAAGHCVMD